MFGIAKWKWSVAGLAAGAAWVAISPVAVAQGDPMGGLERMVAGEDEESDAYQEMLRLSALGNEHFEAGRFGEAADAYARGYASYPQPILLKNEMITRYLIEECVEAVELGLVFLESGEGSAEDHEDVEAVFGECAMELADGARGRGDWPEVQRWLDFGEPYFYDAGLRDEAQQLRAQVEARAGDDEAAGVEAIETVDAARWGLSSIAGWSLITTGAAALTGATIWYRRHENQVNDLEVLARGVDDGEVPRSEFDEARQIADDDYARAQWAVPTLYGVGAAATLTGVGLLVWPMIGGDEPGTASIQPILGTHQAGAIFILSF